MTPLTSTARAFSAAPEDRRGAGLLRHFESAGYVRAMPGILQPAEPFLDLSGEDIRRRMYLTSDAAGREFCLRPDLTIPVARDYLASPAAGKPAGFCYLGPVFRYRGEGEPAEFLQAGIESFGRRDIAAADAEMLALAVETVARYGCTAPKIQVGDVGMFADLIAALDLPAAWKRRLIKDFTRAKTLDHDLDQMVLDAAARADHQGVLAALAGADPKGARALVTDLLSIAGITAVGGRTVGEIAERFLDQAALGANPRLPQDTRTLIRRFLAVSGSPKEGASALRALLREAGLDLSAALELFESRIAFLADRGVPVDRITFSPGYGRGVDYYTGFVFELHDPARPSERHVVAGGRYDGMLARLGSAVPIPAVGFSAWIERLARIGTAP
jgi:ATP phosphoribosyltransferase regulatory subunit